MGAFVQIGIFMRYSIIKMVLNALYFSGIQAVAGYWTGGVGAILMLHHVRDGKHTEFSPNGHLQISPKFLDRLISKLKVNGYEFVSLEEIHRRFKHDAFDRNAKVVALTLDDGYRDNLEFAVPVFRKHNVPYAIFVTPGFVDGRADLWWEDLSEIIAQRDEIRIAMHNGNIEFDLSTLAKKKKAYKELLKWLTFKTSEVEQRKIVRDLAWAYKIDTKAHRAQQIMNWREISELAQDPLCTIGAHTIHHYAVARLSEKEATWEMRESANILQSELDEKTRFFAFPYGFVLAAGARDFAIAMGLGFDMSLTSRQGVLRRSHVKKLHSLPRISVNGKFQSVRYIVTLLSGLPTLFLNRGSKKDGSY